MLMQLMSLILFIIAIVIVSVIVVVVVMVVMLVVLMFKIIVMVKFLGCVLVVNLQVSFAIACAILLVKHVVVPIWRGIPFCKHS